MKVYFAVNTALLINIIVLLISKLTIASYSKRTILKSVQTKSRLFEHSLTHPDFKNHEGGQSRVLFFLVSFFPLFFFPLVHPLTLFPALCLSPEVVVVVVFCVGFSVFFAC